MRPPAVRPAPPPPRGGRFLPPPRFDDRTRRRHHPRRHHYRPALHTPFFATSRHFFFNAWCWDPYGEAFVPATLNPVFDPYWGWRGVGGFWWERAYATQYAYTGTILNPATQYAYTAAIDPVTQKAVIPEPAPEDVRTPEQANDEMTDLLLPEDRASDFDDVYDDLLVESVDTTLDTRSLYTETLDPTRILQSYHGLDRETGDDRFLTDYLEEYDDENE